MPKAYSYTRFSSERQKFGVSAERQLEAATRYSVNHSLDLDSSTYKDLGVSAFRSKNVEGALGAFIEAVDAGRIEKGSYLLVESLDRLSRDSVDVALELFLGITRRGIVIVTLMDGEKYSSATIRENWTKLIVALAIMARANEESLTKSRRAVDAFERRLARGEFPNSRLPSWMKRVDCKTAVLIPERVAVIRRIFAMALDGHSTHTIARTLNDEKVPVLQYAPEWRQSTVSILLRKTATYGVVRGKKVYPAAITEDVFKRTQAVVKARRLFHGSSSPNPHNIFAGAYCGHCGRIMRFQPVSGKAYYYMRCYGSAEFRSCPGRMFPFISCEAALVGELAREANRAIGKDVCSAQDSKRKKIEQQIAAKKKRQRDLVQLADLAGRVTVVADQLRKLEHEIAVLEAALKDLFVFPVGAQEAAANTALFSRYAQIPDKTMRYERGVVKESPVLEFRRQLKAVIARTVRRIEFKNASDGWSPSLVVTFINDRKTVVDVTPHLPPETRTRLSHGIHHSATLGRPMRSGVKRARLVKARVRVAGRPVFQPKAQLRPR